MQMGIPDLMVVNGVAVSWRCVREKRKEMLEAARATSDQATAAVRNAR